MAGRHSATPRDGERGQIRRFLPAIAGVAVALTLVGGAATAFTLHGPSHPSAVKSPPTDGADLDRDDDRSDQRADRADRGELDTAAPASPTATTSPTQTPTQTPSKTTAPPTTSGAATSTGTCKASYYATGSTTANGEAYNPDGITAAHKTLAFNTRVRVTNVANGKSVVVRINDRGPFVTGRCLDLSRGAFTSIASLSAGVLSVKYEVLA